MSLKNARWLPLTWGPQAGGPGSICNQQGSLLASLPLQDLQNRIKNSIKTFKKPIYIVIQ